MIKLFRRHKLVGVIVTLILVAIGVLLFLNPFNLFVQEAENFSIEKFKAIEVGMPKEKVIILIGMPLRKIEHDSHVQGCGLGCSTYYYMGDPPEWLVYYKEAWVVVDASGKVAFVTLNEEP